VPRPRPRYIIYTQTSSLVAFTQEQEQEQQDRGGGHTTNTNQKTKRSGDAKPPRPAAAKAAAKAAAAARGGGGGGGSASPALARFAPSVAESTVWMENGAVLRVLPRAEGEAGEAKPPMRVGAGRALWLTCDPSTLTVSLPRPVLVLLFAHRRPDRSCLASRSSWV
jgi:hypothetical protein